MGWREIFTDFSNGICFRGLPCAQNGLYCLLRGTFQESHANPYMSELFTTDTIGIFLEKTTEKYPNHEFIVFPDLEIRWSFAVFNERVDHLACGLLHVGIAPGDHVGIWANNVPDWLTFFFAVAKIGAVLVPLNTFFKRRDAEYVIANSDMKALALVDHFRDSNYREILLGLIPEMTNTTLGQLKSERFPKLQTLIYLGEENHPGMSNTEELLRLGENVSIQEYRKIVEAVSCYDTVNIQYTSGTTGFPKGVMLTHHNILNNGYYIGECQRFTQNDRLCLPVPLFHCFGITLGILITLTYAATLVVLESFDPVKVLASVEKERCTVLHGVPSMFISELNHPELHRFDLSSLRTGVMSGAPCPHQLMRQVMKKMSMREVTIAYGFTEASPIFTQTDINDPIEKRVETVGKKHPHVEVKIVDPQTGEELGPCKVGEICCRGYNAMKGYYKNPDATAQVIDADGWLHTGDLGEVDEYGYYKITGRLKDMIIRGGENVYPREIEEFLFTIEGIQDAQVVGIPDQKLGEIVVAFVIPKSGQSLTESYLCDVMKNDLARYKIPYHFFFVEEFPMTASGKVQKYKLREMAITMLGTYNDRDFELPL
jgi:fatty-acyl-CoA synthase